MKKNKLKVKDNMTLKSKENSSPQHVLVCVNLMSLVLCLGLHGVINATPHPRHSTHWLLQTAILRRLVVT